jgi:hypothetical protein
MELSGFSPLVLVAALPVQDAMAWSDEGHKDRRHDPLDTLAFLVPSPAPTRERKGKRRLVNCTP